MIPSLNRGDVEVDQKAKTMPGEFEIGQHLGHVDRKDGFDSFQLHDQASAYHKIEAQPCIQPQSVLDDRQLDLALHFQASLVHLMSQAKFVNAFEQSRTQPFVNCEAGVHYLRCDCVRLRAYLPSWCLGALVVHPGTLPLC